MLADRSAGERMLNALTERQKDVMERVLQHRTSKEIARDLGISPNTVDQRINAVREKLNARDRSEAARIYAGLKAICGKTTYDSPVVDLSPKLALAARHGDEIEPVFTLHDSAIAAPVSWIPDSFPVAARARFVENKLWRVAAIVGIAVGSAALGSVVLAVMNALNTLL